MLRVHWVDSSAGSTTPWRYVEEVCESGEASVAAPCISCGFLIKKTAQVMILAGHLSNDDMDEDTQCSGEMAIPLCAVTKIEYLEAEPNGDDL
jgi:hypothetical protein